MTVNKVILVGNLGQDPDVRKTAGGSAVCNLRIATSERRKDRDGNFSEHTEWHSVVVFGKQAETVARYLQKGRQVYIEGKLQTRKWQDKNGNDRYSTEIVADMYGGVRFLGSKSQSSGGYSSQSSGYSGKSYNPDVPDEEMPF